MFKNLLTDPKTHNPNNFTYLTHGIILARSGSSLQQVLKHNVNRIRDPSQYYSASMIAHLNSRSARQRLGWQYGEVNQMGCYGGTGIIVEPAHDGLVQIAWNCDVGSPADPRELKRFVQNNRGKIIAPMYLLTQTKGPYNELMLKGHKKTRIKGVYYQVLDSEREHEGQHLGEIVSEMMRRDIPIVALPAQTFKNYRNIKNEKDRKLAIELDRLMEGALIAQAYSEFLRYQK